MSRSGVPVRSAGLDPRMLRGDSKVSRAPSSPTSGLSIGATVIKSDAPLAARRGKSLGGLILQGSVIEQLEYPDIPTAFRGSPSVWSPQFDVFPVPSFTDHQNMLSDLKLKGASLRSGVSTYNPENSYPHSEVTRTAPKVAEWTFARGPATFVNISGPVGDEVPKEIPSPSVFLPDDSSTPARGLGSTPRPGFVSRPHSTPTLRSPIRRSGDPPGTPLPPRPALVNPSTPPHVRGILKKAKSVRFEDMITQESESCTSPVVCPPQASPERPSPLPLAVSSERPCTPMPNTANPSNGPAPVKEALGKNTQEKKFVPKSRLPPKRTRVNGRLELNVGNAPETSKPALATTSVGRPCRNAHVKENTNPAAVPRAPTKQKGLSTTEVVDVRRGIEGTTKSRLSTPLRNIFRFR